MDADTYTIAAAIIFAGWLIAQAVEKGLTSLGARIARNHEQMERIGNKLDRMWGPIEGIRRKIDPSQDSDWN